MVVTARVATKIAVIETESRALMKTKSGERGVSSALLDDKLQQHIGNKLKRYYDEIVSEDVPDRFKQLLDQLEMTERPTAAATEKTESDA